MGLPLLSFPALTLRTKTRLKLLGALMALVYHEWALGAKGLLCKTKFVLIIYCWQSKIQWDQSRPFLGELYG